MKLIEQIVEYGFSGGNRNAIQDVELQQEQLRRVALSAPIIDISNVADYYFTGTSQDFFDIREDFPSVAPPFPVFWMEWMTPSTLKNRSGDEAISVRTRNGALWQFRTVSEIGSGDFCGGLNHQAIELAHRNPGTKWIGLAGRFVAQGHTTYPSVFGSMYAIADDGRPLAHALVFDTRTRIGKEEANALLAGFHSDLLAISFMHCKNVTVLETKRSFAERHASRGKRPTVKMYTLSIEPMKQVLKNEGKSEEIGIRKALHICRGHFKDYRQSGLFGKIKGIFWWDSAVRGSSHRGVIIKDYAVKAPVL